MAEDVGKGAGKAQTHNSANKNNPATGKNSKKSSQEEGQILPEIDLDILAKVLSMESVQEDLENTRMSRMFEVFNELDDVIAKLDTNERFFKELALLAKLATKANTGKERMVK